MGAICDTHKKVSVEILYNSLHRKSNQFWRPDQLGEDAGSRNISQRGWAPQAPGWAAQENGKETLMAIRMGVTTLQFCSALQLPLTHNPFK